ncbi:MAG: protein kinase domain-containing protein [Isosphaeraceae bacterium]
MDTERNLLFGVVAFQNGAVDAGALAETCASMAAEPTMGLGDMLVQRGLMTDEQKADLEATVSHELASHGGDPHATLAATLDGRSLEAMSGLAGALGLFDPAGAPPSPLAGPAGQGGHIVLESLSPGDADSRERYTLTHLHAKGGMGRVWLARDGSLGRQIALKELRPDQTDNTIVCSRFLYEAKITAQLEHPGIVPVYELSEGDVPYYTMRFVRGRTLSEAIRAYHKRRAAGEADPVELHDLLTAFVDVCNAVAYAHSRGIIHRDLKGQNVVLGDFGEHIVLDWGLAKRVGPDPARPPAPQPAAPTEAIASDRLVPEAATAVTCAAPGLDDNLMFPEGFDDATSPGTFSPGGAGSGNGSNGNGSASAGSNDGSTGSAAGREIPESGAGPEGTMQGQLLGTPAYMAPEQAKARHDLVDQRTDIYGLGAILYEILVGRPPFVAPKTSEILRKVGNEAPTPPRQIVPTVAPGIEAVCLKAIRKNKADRYQSASDLAQEVRRYLADEPVLAYAEPWTQKTLRWARRHRTKVAAGVAALAVVAVALACSTWIISGERREAETQGEQARQAVNLLAKGADIAFDDQLDPMQKEILENALAYYARFTSRASGKPEVRLEHGQAWWQMGDFERKLGRLAESEAAYGKAIGLLEPLAAGRDGAIAVEARRSLARTRTLLGDLLVRRGADRGRANVLYRQALEAQLALAGGAKEKGKDRAEAATTGDIVGLGQTFKSQADLLRHDGKFAEARQTYRRAISELGRALAADAGHPVARNELALAHDARGLVETELGDATAAEADFGRAIELLEKLVAEFPTASRHREVLAGACSHLGWLEAGAGRLDQAEAHLRREVALDERLAGDFRDRPEYRRELARGLTKLGHILQVQGRATDGDPIIRRAIELNSGILKTSPDDVLVRLQLAISHHDLGLLLTQVDPDAAVASFNEAKAINEALAKQFPDKPRYRADLADNLDGLALALTAAGKPGADEAFRSAEELYQKLVAEFPANAEYRMHLAMSLRNQGKVLADAGKKDRAESIYLRGLALLDVKDTRAGMAEWQRTRAGLLINVGDLKSGGSEAALRDAIAITARLAEGKDKEGSGEDRHLLAIARNNMAEVLIHQKRAPEAGPFFEQAVADFEKLAAAAPRSAEIHFHFGSVLSGQGNWLDQAGKTAEAKGVLASAVAHDTQAVKLSKGSAVCKLALGEHLIALTDVNRKLGDYTEAARLALEVPRAVPNSARAQACFDAARALARLVAQVGADRKVPEKERDHLTRVYLTRTVVLLRDAVDARPELAGAIQSDPDIKVIESRPEFQVILNTLVEAGR